MMITTIQLHENVKHELDKVKEGKQTYEEVILALLKNIQQQKRKQKDLLIEGYKEMAQESIKITKEFKPLEEDVGWEWK
jgi:predicted CopG family antitoxin